MPQPLPLPELPTHCYNCGTAYTWVSVCPFFLKTPRAWCGTKYLREGCTMCGHWITSSIATNPRFVLSTEGYRSRHR